MERKALLFGNSNGLSGVKLDIANFKKFLKSDFGGRWLDSEIIILMNPSKSELLNKIKDIKNQQPDYAFVLYSGHGAYTKETVLEINGNGDTVNESELKNIASRQISIFDCCRGVILQPLFEDKTYSETIKLFDSYSRLREKYDNRILQAIEQQVSLYACTIGQSSYDTEKGGIYSNSFLSCTKPNINDSFKLVGIAQDEATPITKAKAWELYKKVQIPGHSIPKCISQQQLIISINPNF
jgi:hypothetical protein